MEFKYCPDCGNALTPRDLGDDKGVPFCTACNKPWFPIFSTCVIALVHDDDGNVLLLRQDYISGRYANLVSGYMVPGETAEEAVRREVAEETGLTVTDLTAAGTYWFKKKGLLMLGYLARVDAATPVLSVEVDGAAWHPAAEAPLLVHPAGSVSHTLADIYLDRLNKQRDGLAEKMI